MRRIAVATGVCLILAVAVVWWLRRPAPGPPPIADIGRIGSLRVTGLGLLENNRPRDSVDAFEQLIAAVPDQPLGYRNLAVARLMIFQETDRGDPARGEAFEQAVQALDRLAEIEPESAAVHVLAARSAADGGRPEVAWDAYERALAAAAPEDRAAIRFEQFRFGQISDIQRHRAESRQAAREAAEAAPRNSAALLEWLVVQAEDRDPEIAATIAQASDVLAPLDASIRGRVNVSILELLDAARQSAADEDWPAVIRSVRTVVNVVRPEELLRSDLRQLDRNVLEFVIVDFPEEFYRRYDVRRVDPGDPIPVRFVHDASVSPPDLSSVIDFTVADFNLDGLPDLIVLQPDRLTVWTRPDVAGPWQQSVVFDLDKRYRKVIAADFDSDFVHTLPGADVELPAADLDLIIFGDSGWTILENRADDDGRRRLIERPIDSPDDKVLTIAVGDFDLDGDLDLFISSENGCSVWANFGDFRFEPWDDDALIGLDDLRPIQAIPVDWDRDVDLDLLLVEGDGGRAGVLENLRHSRMRWQPLDDSFGPAASADRIAVDDVDGNASWDLLTLRPEGMIAVTTRTPVPGRVTVESVIDAGGMQFAAGSRILHLFDYDNDGAGDLVIEQDGRPRLLRHLGAGRYELQPADILPEDLTDVAKVESADIDADGGLDLIVLGDGRLEILLNEGGNANRWVDIRLVAQQVRGGDVQASGRVNAYGYGSLLELKHGNSYQARVVSSPVTRFGLGSQESADIARIVWTNGIPQNVLRPESNRTVTELQTLKGSCPYLYAWSGDGFEFVTDLLWAAPLGLQTTSGTILPDRPWEYLKIDGDKLKAKDGRYQLRITEELWEIAYFDHVSLIVVDHPAEVEIFTNEKVGPAELAEPKLHVVGRRRWPMSAINSQGRDVIRRLRDEDDMYLKAYEEKYCQGYVSDHHIEIDLGHSFDYERLTLFLTGWIRPTDTSLNIQLSQDPDRPGPRPPYLMVPDGAGGWVEARDFIGFPGGKTKTIAVDISDLPFPAGDRRLRICTSSEIYWDTLFFTVDPPEVELREQPLKLLSADLRYRGVSERIEHQYHGPERYDYDRVSEAAAWPPIEGNFTRYGDVAEVLRRSDDRLVVMGSGDELALVFEEPSEPLPPGWKRDYVIHCVGWDKDADLNTVYGETVEPLPFRTMGSYPTLPEVPRPDSESYRRYLDEYQTRRMPAGAFRNQVRNAVSRSSHWRRESRKNAPQDADMPTLGAAP